MTALELAALFTFVVLLGAGIPGPGDASLIAAGTLAGEGYLTVWLVLVVAALAWMVGSLAGYVVGRRGGRALLEHRGHAEGARRNLLAKGDRTFYRHRFVASATMPAFVSGIFRVPLGVFILGAITAGIFWIGIYVGLAYVFGEQVARLVGRIGTKALVSVIVAVCIGFVIRYAVRKRRRGRVQHVEAAAAAGSQDPQS